LGEQLIIALSTSTPLKSSQETVGKLEFLLTTRSLENSEEVLL